MRRTLDQIPLVGRDSELAELEAEFRRACRGEFRCLLIEGQPGIGKSRLAAEFQRRHGSGAITLAARGYDLGASSPFGLWIEALEGYLRGLPDDEVRSLCAGASEALATLLPSIAALRRGETAGPSSRAGQIDGLARLLAGLTRDRPVIIHLDDVHLADASSSEVLDFLAHNLTDAPALVVACARSKELAANLAWNRAISRLERDVDMRMIEVEPLAFEATEQLAAAFFGRGLPPKALVDWLFERSRGNPLFATALLRAMIAEGADPARPALATVPHPLRRTVIDALGAVPQDARRLVDLLVVLGRRVTIGDLASFSGRSLEDLADDLQAAVDSGLVVEHSTAGPPTYEIAHPLIEEALYVSMTEARRLSLHRRIGRVLTDAGRWGEGAPHVARGAKAADREAVKTLLDAARRLWSLGAFHEAFTTVAASVEILPPGDPQWVDVLDVLSLEGDWFYYHRGDIHASAGIRMMREIENVLEGTDDHTRLAAFNFHLGGFLGWGMGDLHEAERRVEAAVELLRAAGDEHSALMAAIDHAWILGLEGDFARQEAAARAVLDEAEQAADHGAMLMACGCVANATGTRGHFPEAESLLRQSIELAKAEGNALRLQYGQALLAWGARVRRTHRRGLPAPRRCHRT